MANVLVVVADAGIEALLSELVAFAGHKPIHDATCGAAGESVRRSCADVTLIDTSLAEGVVALCLSAADEVGSRVVLVSSMDSTSELADRAQKEHCMYFPLPGGPRPLRSVLDQALSVRWQRPISGLPDRSRRDTAGVPVHPALCAALAGVARARVLQLQAAHLSAESRVPCAQDREILGEAQRSRKLLRATVTDFARQLRRADVPEDEALTRVQDAICDCATVVGAEPAMELVLLESENWTREVYAASA